MQTGQNDPLASNPPAPGPAPLLLCYRCGTSWRQRKATPPKRCPKCQSPNWHKTHLSAQDLLGPPPPKIADLGDKQILLMPRTLPELRSLNVDILESANWLQDGINEAQRQLRRVQQHARNSLDILERLVEATAPKPLPLPVLHATPQPPAPEKPPAGPPQAIPESPPAPPQPRPPRPARKPTRRSTRSRRPSG